MKKRHEYTNAIDWFYLGPAMQGLNEDVAALEAGTGKTREQVGVASSHGDVRPFLPTPRP